MDYIYKVNLHWAHKGIPGSTKFHNPCWLCVFELSTIWDYSVIKSILLVVMVNSFSIEGLILMARECGLLTRSLHPIKFYKCLHQDSVILCGCVCRTAGRVRYAPLCSVWMEAWAVCWTMHMCVVQPLMRRKAQTGICAGPMPHSPRSEGAQQSTRIRSGNKMYCIWVVGWTEFSAC